MQLPQLNPLHQSLQELLHLPYSPCQLHRLQPLHSQPLDQLLAIPHLQYSSLTRSPLLTLQNSNPQLQFLPELEVLVLLPLHLILMMMVLSEMTM